MIKYLDFKLSSIFILSYIYIGIKLYLYITLNKKILFVSFISVVINEYEYLLININPTNKYSVQLQLRIFDVS